ncbi:MAG: transcriptional regulator [Ignavibacteria bacterium]|nr:transcriptional regulator [Ignavibacteria bacterium]
MNTNNRILSGKANFLLESLISQNKNFFNIQDAIEIIENSSITNVSELLRSIARRGRIRKISAGLYCIVPLGENADTYLPDWHLTAKELVNNSPYYIGFYSALDIHGLITQPSLTEQVVTSKQFIPKHKKIGSVKFEFIYFNEKHFFGFENTWIDKYDKIQCSDLEKTFIDCLYKPGYGSGITEIVKAIYKARDKISEEKMLNYLEKFDSQAVMKRLGFILSKLDILYMLRKYLQSNITKVYTPLDPSLPSEGKYHSQWSIQENIQFEEIKNSLEN